MRTRPSMLLSAVLVVAGCTACVRPPIAPPGGGGGSSTASGPTVSGCPTFPSNNPWNTDITHTAVRSDSAQIIANIQSAGGHFLHADFGGGGRYGIPFISVASTQPKLPINYTAYGDESDAGPFPIPLTAPIEGGSSSTGDRHVLVVQRGACRLYELYRAFPRSGHWDADAGVNWNLRSNALRTAGFTSADAAGLPILPGLARPDEVAAGAINHALRVTFNHTRRGYVLPATHFASSSSDPSRPAMGMRLRLKASYDLSRFHGAAKVILVALQHYGLIVADNGSNWFITGAADTAWDDNDLNQLKSVPGDAFDVVNTGTVHTG